MGKNSKNQSISIKFSVFLFIIISIIAVVLFRQSGEQPQNLSAISSTVTWTPTPTPTQTPTIGLTPTIKRDTPQSPVATPSNRTPVNANSDKSDQSTTIPAYTYEVVATYPHDPQAFTQGLIFVDGTLYEGTGRYAQSTLRKVDLTTGEILQIHHLPSNLFGEGITLFENKIIQLTWKAGQGFVYDAQTFELIREFYYPTEGWGITHDSQRLIMSDGTATLYFWDSETFEEIGRITVFDETGPVTLLNELEYIDGQIFANIWKTDRIAKIDPQTGQVTGWIVFTGLLSPEELVTPADMQNGIAVLNGIAYDEMNDRLFVTGKLWPKLFEVKYHQN